MMQALKKCKSIVLGLVLGFLVSMLAMPHCVVAQTSGIAPEFGERFRTERLASVTPFSTETGFISLSVDGLGSNAASGIIQVQKPVGATVRKAFMAAASTGFSGRRLVPGDVTINQTGFAWNLVDSLRNSISSYNSLAEVTSIVKPTIDAAPAGRVSFTITEVTTAGIDGEILAVIFDDPNQTTTNTVVLLFGAQNITGDDFVVGLATPINLSDPNLKLDMGLGISFSVQNPPGNINQISRVDVNGARISSAAGGQDDGPFPGVNGTLLTVGGLDDSNNNPPPLSPPTQGDSIPDDELYNLIPFVTNGATSIRIHTINPSNDDNVFFASLFLGSQTAIVGEGIILTPQLDTNIVGTQHTLTATVQNDSGGRIQNRLVTFAVKSGPHVGTTGAGTTNANGQVTFTYTGNFDGTDVLIARMINTLGRLDSSVEAKKVWKLPLSRVQVTFAGDTVVGSPINLSVQGPQTFVANSATLFFRKAGRPQFDSLALTRVGQTQAFTGNFPDTVVTERGIEYFVRIIGPQETITNPESNAVGNPLRLRVKVAVIAFPLQLQARVYRMASVPLELTDGRVSTQLFDDYGPYDPTRYRLFAWISDSNRYAEYDPLEDGHISLGEAYWIITNDGHGADVQDGRSTLSDRPFSILLEPGWNQVGCPFAFPVSLDAADPQTLFFFDGDQYIPRRVFKPWEGYFVFNNLNQVTPLTLQPAESPTLGKNAEPIAIRGDNDYLLQFSATSGTMKDTYNYVGIMENASHDFDRFDLPEPPMIGDFIDLFIEQDQTKYLANFKPVNSEGQQWEMRVTSTLPNRTVRISVNEIGVLRSGFNVYVLDEDEFAAVPLTERSFSVRLGVANSIRSFKVIIGTKSFAEQSSTGIPLVPVEYALAQNYPNPFNPSTTIRYSLSKRSDVALEIYNTLGQKVRTLVQGEQTTGTYSVVWDGSTHAGTSASSGVYFYRLRAGEFRLTKKLLLLR